MNCKEAILCFDSNCDGWLTNLEAINAVHALGIYLYPDEEKKWFSKLTFTKGLVRAEDLLPALEELVAHKNLRVRLTEMFSVFDTEKSGFISAHEFAEILRTIGEMLNPQERDALVGLANENGKINYNSLINALLAT